MTLEIGRHVALDSSRTYSDVCTKGFCLAFAWRGVTWFRAGNTKLTVESEYIIICYC